MFLEEMSRLPPKKREFMTGVVLGTTPVSQTSY